MKLFLYYFLLFFIYAFVGWLIETINCSILAKKKVLNRGFLIGPYIPIYGVASVLMVLFLNEYRNDPFVLFWMAVVYSSLLEYVTSYLMEKIFKARWWDYSNKKFNLNGRICLQNCFLFGLLGIILLYGLNPLVEGLLKEIPSNILMIISVIFLSIFILDLLITIYLLSKLDIQIKNTRSDATNEIDKEIKKMLRHYRIFYKRLFKAFPKINFNVDRGNLLIDRIRKQFDEIDNLLDEKKKEIIEIKAKIKDLKTQELDKNIRLDKKKELKTELKKVRRRKI